MAAEQMKFIKIVGPINQFHEFILEYVINKNIQLEASHRFIDTAGLIPFEDDSSLDNLKKRLHILNERFHVKLKKYDRHDVETRLLGNTELKEIEAFTVETESRISDYRKQSGLYKADIEKRRQIINQLQPLAGLEVDIDEFFNLSFMRFRFGFIPKEAYVKQKNYLQELEVVIIPVSEENDNVWMSYFIPASSAKVIDNVFSAVGFERVRISGEVKGTPKTAIEKLSEEIELLTDKMDQSENLLAQFLNDRKEQFEHYYHWVLYFSKINEVRKNCAHTRETFFLVGWIPQQDCNQFTKEVENKEQFILECENPERVTNLEPPTVLKNRGIFKPFESLVTMYGIPSSKELDPTPLTAITYVLMFGIMFGDVGQGAIIALLGAYLYKWKKSSLGGMIMYVGLSSTIFGFVYGSVFGSEEFLRPLWLNPLHDKNTINTLLYGAIGYGAIIIVITMIINMINNIRTRNWGKLLFDKNGLAGFLFYGGLIALVLNFIITGKFVMTALAWIIVVIVPATMIIFKEPLENLIERKEDIFPKEKGMYFIEAFFDVFETVMSFFSGTVSFARVGAFALNHAGLSLAVWTLYSMMQGVGGIIVVIFGNILTIGLEGLIVAIQCMRLEYYEMFGRYYTGDGKEFKPVTITED